MENPTNDDRIFNGEDAKLGQFPHQVLWVNTASFSKVYCGGSIYNESTIITAARCCVWVDRGPVHLKDTRIIAGKIDIDDAIVKFSFKAVFVVVIAVVAVNIVVVDTIVVVIVAFAVEEVFIEY